MQQLTVGSSKQMTKKDRLSQRLAFREILGSIRDNGRCSETVIRLKHGDSLRVDTWTLTVQLNALRRFLADGFQRHLQVRPLLLLSSPQPSSLLLSSLLLSSAPPSCPPSLDRPNALRRLLADGFQCHLQVRAPSSSLPACLLLPIPPPSLPSSHPALPPTAPSSKFLARSIRYANSLLP
ncbi:unnamed protein product [Closterium sp. NIES-54]